MRVFSVTASGTAVCAGSQVTGKFVGKLIVQADPANSAAVLLGDADKQIISLSAGVILEMGHGADLSKLYINGTGTVNFMEF